MVDRIKCSSNLMDYVQALENKGSYERGELVLSTLTAMGFEPFVQTCRWPRINNIIVDFMPNTCTRYLLFSAHYDVVKGSPGANDNASGLAVLLGLCEGLRCRRQPVRIVFFDREEAWLRTRILRLGLLGSLYYVWKTDLKNVVAMYNLEFCGQGDLLGLWPIKDKEINITAVQQIKKAALRLGVSFKSAHIPWQLLSSDHLSFRLRGLSNAVTLSLLPSDQAQSLERFLETMSFTKLLTGQRLMLPEMLHDIHSSNDTSSELDESSLKLMLSLLLELIRGWAIT